MIPRNILPGVFYFGTSHPFFSFSLCTKPFGMRGGVWTIAKPVLVTGKTDGGFSPVHGTFPALPKRHGASESIVRNALDGIIIAHGMFIGFSALTCNPAVFRLAKGPFSSAPGFRHAHRQPDGGTFLRSITTNSSWSMDGSRNLTLFFPDMGVLTTSAQKTAGLRNAAYPSCGQCRKLQKKCFRKP